MIERVTAQTQTNNALSYFRKQTLELSRLQTDIATGKRIDRPSENPSDFALLQAGKAKDLRFDSYKNTVNDATSQLNSSVSTLTELNAGLTRARSLAQEGINATTEPAAFEALAKEVDSILERALTSSNATADGRFLFGGTSTNTPPFTVGTRNTLGEITSITYQGADERGQGLIGPDQTVDTQYSGNRVFQTGGSDVFKALVELRDALRDTSLSSANRATVLSDKMRQVESASTALLGTVGEQSADLGNLEAVGSRLADLQLEVRSRNSDIESTDVASAIIKLRETENIFQSSLAVAARVFNNNLLDFVR
jgi:flagellar hook-associated protein 3 FlgL